MTLEDKIIDWYRHKGDGSRAKQWSAGELKSLFRRDWRWRRIFGG